MDSDNIDTASRDTRVDMDEKLVIDEEAIPPQNSPSAPLGSAGKEKDSNLVDWDGPSDPENPQNWSLPRKIFVSGVIIVVFPQPQRSGVGPESRFA